MNVKAVIDRMRSQEAKDNKRIHDLGERCGNRWAAERATAAQLRRLEDEDNQSAVFDGDGSPFAKFVQLIDPATDGRDARDFWEREAGDDFEEVHMAHEIAFVEGFIDGAMTIWDNVSAEL
jgi:hypothetical protein